MWPFSKNKRDVSPEVQTQAQNLLKEMEKNKDITDFFLQGMERKRLYQDEASIHRIVVSVLSSFKQPLEPYGIEISLPYSLCIRKKGEFPSIGVVRRHDTAERIALLFRDVYGATPVTLGSIACVNLRIGGADYPFYFADSCERVRLDTMPKDVTIVMDKGSAISSGIDGYGFYMDRPVVYER